jgi:hypothetical protein
MMCIEDARTHFLRGRHHDVEHGARVSGQPVFPQPAEDVLDPDHRVVDQFADRDREAAQRHGVD